MENATKALIIAGAVLITILIITLGIYLVGQLRKGSDSYVTKLDTIELQKYNANFNVYIGRNNISAQEIVTVVSIAKQKNLGTKVFVDGVDIISKKSTDKDLEKWKNEFLMQYILTDDGTGKILNTFTCSESSVIYDEEGKISEIKFKKNL